MATISFTFPSAMAGAKVGVFTERGQSAEKPTTLVLRGGFAVCSLELAAGSYIARVDGAENTGGTTEVFDDATIAAGGGGVPLDGPHYQCEVNSGQAVPGVGNHTILWDTIDPALTIDGGGQLSGLSAGWYTADIELDFDDPDAAWTCVLTIFPTTAGNSIAPSAGPMPILAGADYSSHSASAQFTFRVQTPGLVSIKARLDVDPLAVAPTDLNIGYGLLVITQIG